MQRATTRLFGVTNTGGRLLAISLRNYNSRLVDLSPHRSYLTAPFPSRNNLSRRLEVFTSLTSQMRCVSRRSKEEMDRLFPVEHKPNQSLFEIKLSPDGVDRALLEYSVNDKVLDFYHTEVPEKYNGQGIAAHLVGKAFDWAAANGYKVIPSCSYVSQTFLPKYPVYNSHAVWPERKKNKQRPTDDDPSSSL
eukprot:TRINITY_DN3733_c0_g1_i1.p1 TRINITY_DN3733_c0_g1~~TRINITY_DN3733_c0_g1_i1.p1  ORF type:complete len:192 (-),score=17.04 TRINITY_DN3733_c0_g1_i1:191-766(-)